MKPRSTNPQRLGIGGMVFCWAATVLVCSNQCSFSQPKNPPDKLDVSLFPQENPYWCWAASGEMAMHYFTKMRIRQCDQADSVFMETICCKKPVPEPCSYGGWVEYEKWGFATPTRTRRALLWNEVVKQINGKMPFTFSWTKPDGSAHTMVCYGYSLIGGDKVLLIKDPLPIDEGTESAIPYNDYSGNAKHLHLETFYNIKLKQKTP